MPKILYHADYKSIWLLAFIELENGLVGQLLPFQVKKLCIGFISQVMISQACFCFRAITNIPIILTYVSTNIS